MEQRKICVICLSHGKQFENGHLRVVDMDHRLAIAVKNSHHPAKGVSIDYQPVEDKLKNRLRTIAD